MKRKDKGILLGASILMMSVSAYSSNKRNPNIIMIMCDDLGWGDTGFNGSKVIKTPNLDQLASKGIIFNRFYSASAVCSPTRASLLTGRNPYRIGIPNANSGHMKKEEITIPELLKEKDYATGHFGKWHLGTLTTKMHDANRAKPGKTNHYSIPTMHGYDQFFCTESKVPTFDPMIYPETFDKSKGESKRYGWKAISNKNKAKNYGTKYWNGEEKYENNNLEGVDCKVIMDRAIPFIEKSVKGNKKFFTTIWLHTPHLPVVASEKYMSMYPDRNHREKLYYGCITAMDDQIGRLVKKLELLGISDNTMIWFCSDNGPEVRTPGTAGKFRGKKRDLYEGGIRVPAFCVWPNKIKPGITTDYPTFTSDYLPTIKDILEIKKDLNRPIDGVSIKKILEGSNRKRKSPLGFHYLKRTSWVTHKHKLISTDKGQTYELYNLIKDPYEKKDISAKHPNTVRKMKKELLHWIESCKKSEQGLDY